MNSTPEPISQGLVAAESDAQQARLPHAFPRVTARCTLALMSLLLAGSLMAQERKPVDAPRGERPANPEGAPRERAANLDAAPRGERAANPDGARRGGPLVNPDGTLTGDRAANPGAPRGERPAGPERT